METAWNFGQVLLAWVAMLALVYVAFLFFNRWVFPSFSFGAELKKGNVAVGVFLGLLFLGLFMFAGDAFPASTHRYDRDFRKAGYREFGMRVDWMNFKSQAMTESFMRTAVCSHVGACGLMQFMPATAREMGLQNRFDAKASIRAGIGYDKRLWRVFKAPRPCQDRLDFAFMAYNAGLGNVLKFQRRAAAAGVDPNRFATIAPFVWKEPREYVERIARWRKRFRKGVDWASC